jgi:hypothetical protein
MGKSIKLRKNKKTSSAREEYDDYEDTEKYRPRTHHSESRGGLKSVRLVANTPVPFQENLPSAYDVGQENPSLAQLAGPKTVDLNEEEENVISSIGNSRSRFAVQKKQKQREDEKAMRREMLEKEREAEEEDRDYARRYDKYAAPVSDEEDVDRPLYDDEDPADLVPRPRKSTKSRPAKQYAADAPASNAPYSSYAATEEEYPSAPASEAYYPPDDDDVIDAEQATQEAEKADLLHKLNLLRTSGVALSKKRGYTEKDSLQTLRLEWGRLEHQKAVISAKKKSYYAITNLANGLEIVQKSNKVPAMMRGSMTNFGHYVSNNLDQYDDAIARLAEMYGDNMTFGTSAFHPVVSILLIFSQQLAYYMWQRAWHMAGKTQSLDSSSDMESLVNQRVREEASRIEKVYQQNNEALRAQMHQLQQSVNARAPAPTLPAQAAMMPIHNPLYAQTPALNRTFPNQTPHQNNEVNMFVKAMENESQMAQAIGAPPPLYVAPMPFTRQTQAPVRPLDQQPQDEYQNAEAGRGNDRPKNKDNLPPGPKRRSFNPEPIITESNQRGIPFQQISGTSVAPVPTSLRLDQIVQEMKRTAPPPPPMSTRDLASFDPFANAFPPSYVDSAPTDESDTKPTLPKEQLLIVTPELEQPSSATLPGTRKAKNLRVTTITDTPPVIAALLDRQKTEMENNNIDGTAFIRDIVPSMAPNASVKVSIMEQPEDTTQVNIE